MGRGACPARGGWARAALSEGVESGARGQGSARPEMPRSVPSGAAARGFVLGGWTRLGLEGSGMVDSVRGPSMRFWSGASESPWTRPGLETLWWVLKAVGDNPKQLDLIGRECPRTLR